MRKIKILYISSKRAKERDLLSHLRTIEFKEIQIHLRSDKIKFINKLISLFTYIKTFKPDMLLLEGPAMFSLIAVFIKKFFRIPYAVRIKGDFEREYAENEYDIPFYEKIIKYLNYKSGTVVLKHADAILPISNYVGTAIKEELNISKPIYTVHIPYHKVDKDFELNLNIPQKFILSVTNFNFWGKVKPLGDITTIIAPILKEYDFSWVILGDGYFFNKFIQIYNKHKNVKFLGRQNPYPFYKKAKALFYISGMDGLPNVLLEASLFKLPIVIDKNSPAAEFIKNGYNGLVVNCGNIEKVENVIRDLISSHKLREKLGITAFNHVKKNFSVEKISSDFEKILYKILES